ncbi:MAG: glycosyltransferase family 4 protein [Candidatus Omnitrophica bacterium]|nr:glycosyltransferase family 4 protein [Candidatus Omnitrophota bacterium]
MKLLFISNMPSPYQLELFKSIIDNNLAEVHAIFCTWGYPSRDWNKPLLPQGFQVLPQISFQYLLPDFILNFGIKRNILNFNPDIAIVGSYMFPGIQHAASVFNKLNIPWLFWEEYHLFHRNYFKRKIRSYLLARIVQKCNAILAIGNRAKSFFEAFSKGEKNVYNFPYASNLKRFSGKMQSRECEDLCFIYSGQLIERKGIDILLRAFFRIAPHYKNTKLLILGDGLLRKELENMVPRDLLNRVQFKGSLQWDELPEYYNNSDIFVFPSRHDGWGIAPVEAMASSLPVISTREVGSMLDLIQDGYNGFLFEKDDIEGLSKLMVYFCENRPEIKRMGENACKSITDLDVGRAGEKLIGILARVLSENKRAHG